MRGRGQLLMMVLSSCIPHVVGEVRTTFVRMLMFIIIDEGYTLLAIALVIKDQYFN